MLGRNDHDPGATLTKHVGEIGLAERRIARNGNSTDAHDRKQRNGKLRGILHDHRDPVSRRNSERFQSTAKFGALVLEIPKRQRSAIMQVDGCVGAFTQVNRQIVEDCLESHAETPPFGCSAD